MRLSLGRGLCQQADGSADWREAWSRTGSRFVEYPVALFGSVPSLLYPPRPLCPRPPPSVVLGVFRDAFVDMTTRERYKGEGGGVEGIASRDREREAVRGPQKRRVFSVVKVGMCWPFFFAWSSVFALQQQGEGVLVAVSSAYDFVSAPLVIYYNHDEVRCSARRTELLRMYGRRAGFVIDLLFHAVGFSLAAKKAQTSRSHVAPSR